MGPRGGGHGGSKAIPTLPTRYHHPHCQRYPTARIPNAIPPRTLPTLSHHHAVNGIPHCERYRTSHTANAIPPSTLLTLPHLPHCQHYPITCIAESITRIAKSPVPGSTLPTYRSECQAIRLSAKHPNLNVRREAASVTHTTWHDSREGQTPAGRAPF